MADRKGLGIIGFVLGGITAAIVMIGVMVVHAHLDGQLSLEEARPLVSASLLTVVR
jgi:hypothetical protein